ncbi:hypothetical protein GJ496_006690 [Pomphorhynchus laevis]|nr:hypothetical protein GJ496_006690 [Pomphorhynchus laevis]
MYSFECIVMSSIVKLSSYFVLASLISREIRVCLSKSSLPARLSNSGRDIEWDPPYSAYALLDGDRMPIPPIPTGKYNIDLAWQSRETPVNAGINFKFKN